MNNEIKTTGIVFSVDYIIYTGKIIKIGFRHGKSYGNVEIIVPEPEKNPFFNSILSGEIVSIKITKLPIN
ncbi:MAG: hypothetical protein QXY45_03770 [Candidatus Aenigmatarchaeota archaeon]